MSFLGKVVVVEDIETGISMARSFGYSFRIVTLDGDILSTSGSMSGGSTDNRGQGILSRSREIPELKEGIDVLKTKEVEVEDDITNFAKQLNIVLGKMTCEDDIIRNNELIKMRDESHLAQIEENINKVTAKIEMFKDEKSQLERQEEETEKELEKYIKESDEIELDISETKKVVAEYTEKHKIEQTERDNLYMDITDFKISVNSIVESKESIKDSVDRINDERNASHKNISRRNDEKTRNLTEIESLKAKNEGIRNLIRNFEAVKTGKTLQMDRLSEEKKINEEDLYDIVNEITNINKNVMLLQEELNRIEVKKARMEAETDAIQNRLWDDYEVTFTNALENKKDIGSITQAQKRINELKAEIKELGPVNVSAIEDYVKTKERFEFMSIQKNDMEQAEEKLQKVITEMTTIMKRQFIEQFKLINENFNIVFNELFEGGRADLVIVDKENILDSGIEIEVQPPGKKLQNMMLLSGGERAFTAIALLFAILRLRPTPFCVLDEIESALDDANVYRFAEYIRKFTSLTQFIMVTHRKGTMEASDTLYGVTMQERGISKVVSMKMDEKIS